LKCLAEKWSNYYNLYRNGVNTKRNISDTYFDKILIPTKKHIHTLGHKALVKIVLMNAKTMKYVSNSFKSRVVKINLTRKLGCQCNIFHLQNQTEVLVHISV
jgi:hypothetical protein